MPRKRLAAGTFLLLLVLIAAPVMFAAGDTIGYLRAIADLFHSAYDIYTDADAAGNHFAARGRINSTGNESAVPAMVEDFAGATCGGVTCIKAQYIVSQPNGWGGWYFLNGVLSGAARAPSLNWGDTPNAGVNLSGTTQITFRARGENGNEVVQFIALGVGWDPDAGTRIQPYPDSSPRVLRRITLTKDWQQYSLDLTGRDLTYVLGGFGWVAASNENASLQGQTMTFYLDDIRLNQARTQDARFLRSYETIRSSNDFDKVMRNPAFIYDNALALIAFLATGDTTRGRLIADAILYSLDHDRFYTDGRIRSAYQAGDLILPKGWVPNGKADTVRMPGWYDSARVVWFEDQTQVSTSTGNMAWTMLGLLAAHERLGGTKYLDAAERMANWVESNTKDARGAGGYTAGFDGWEPTPIQRLYKATEHNIDLYAAFERLSRLTGKSKWHDSAEYARHFVDAMWDSAGGKFWTGTGEDGLTISRDVIPVDIQVWAIQALADRALPYWRALDYIEANHKVGGGFGFRQTGCAEPRGIDGIWFEGSSQVAVTYLLTGQQAKYQQLIATIRAAQEASGALPAASVDRLCTGFDLNDGQPWLYFKRLHIGATSWFALAEAGVNPFWSGADKQGPTLTITSPGTATATSTTPSIAISGTASDLTGVASVTWSSDRGGSGLATGTTTWSAAAVPLQAGANVVAITARDPAGNSTSATVTVTYTPTGDTGRPTIAITTPTSAGSYTSTTPTLTIGGTASDNVGVTRVSWVNNRGGNGTATGTTSWSFSVALQSGQNAITVTAVDAAGNTTDATITVTWTSSATALRFIPLAPCRVVDTRTAGSAVPGGQSRDFVLAGACNIPALAQAYSINVTVVPRGTLGYLSVWPAGQSRPLVSTLNSLDGRIKANAAIVPAGANGSISVYATDTTDLVLDVNGYFVPASNSNALPFFPLAPCRVVDTRLANGTFGGPVLAANSTRSFAIPQSPCSVPTTAQAYSVNFTVVPRGSLGYLTAWPTGGTQPLVSTLNALNGAVTANAAIVPAGTNGAISVFVAGTTDVIIDVNGYFAPPADNGYSFFPVSPCRISDTRNATGTFGGPTLGAGAGRTYPLPQSSCGVPSAAAYSLNATVVPAAPPLGYLTLWPSGRNQPFVSTLNSLDGSITSNAAIVPADSAGGINAYVTDRTDLILDINGYFANPVIPAPSVAFTFVPGYGVGPGSVAGKVSNVTPASARMALYILVGSGWWTKPYWATPLVDIQADGSFTSAIYTGGYDSSATKVVAFVVNSSDSPPARQGESTLPPELYSTALAYTEFTRTPDSITGQIVDGQGRGIDNVAVVLTGGAQQSVVTQLGGYYAFSNVASALNYTVTPAGTVCTFTPVKRDISALNGQATANFTAQTPASGKCSSGP